MEQLSPVREAEKISRQDVLRNSFGSINRVICDDLVQTNQRVLLKLQETQSEQCFQVLAKYIKEEIIMVKVYIEWFDKHSKNIEDGQRKIFLFEITDSQSLDPEYFIDKF